MEGSDLPLSCWKMYSMKAFSVDHPFLVESRSGSSLAHLDQGKIRLFYRDKDGYLVNIFSSGCFRVLGNASYCERSERPHRN